MGGGPRWPAACGRGGRVCQCVQLPSTGRAAEPPVDAAGLRDSHPASGGSCPRGRNEACLQVRGCFVVPSFQLSSLEGPSLCHFLELRASWWLCVPFLGAMRERGRAQGRGVPPHCWGCGRLGSSPAPSSSSCERLPSPPPRAGILPPRAVHCVRCCRVLALILTEYIQGWINPSQAASGFLSTRHLNGCKALRHLGTSSL